MYLNTIKEETLSPYCLLSDVVIEDAPVQIGQNILLGVIQQQRDAQVL